MKKVKSWILSLLIISVVIINLFALNVAANDTLETETLKNGVQYVLDETEYLFTDYWSVKESERKAPVREGYVFGGWYQKNKEGDYIPLREITLLSEAESITSAYAKFVPAYVLSIVGLNNDGVKANDGDATGIRVLTSVDSTNYQNVGFHIMLNNSINIGTCEMTEVYETVQYSGEPMPAYNVFGEASSYFGICHLKNINDANDSKSIYARPYWTTLDGTTVEGLAKHVHVEDEYKNYINVPINFMTGETIASGTVEMTYDESVFTYVGFEAGKILTNMHEDTTTTGTVVISGESTGGAVKADGLFANVRFAVKEHKSADQAQFLMKNSTFQDDNGNAITSLKAWDVTYQTVQHSKALTFEFLGEDVMPIGGYYGPYSKNTINDNYFSLIDDAGINLLLYSSLDYNGGSTTYKNYLQYGEEYGIGILMNDSNVLGYKGSSEIDAAALEQRIAEYSNYPAFCGMYLTDEPRNDYYRPSSEKDQISDLGALAKTLQYDLDLTCYMNMLPASNLANTKQSYEQYVQEYIDTLAPKYLSWDKYPFESKDDLSVYFYNMNLMRANADKYDIPFWAVIQAGAQFNDEKEYFTSVIPYYPNQNQFQWNVNTCLAFGAQGIQYFPLLQPNHFAYALDAETGEQCMDYDRNGIIGADGNPNQWHQYAKTMNRHIAEIDEVLMNSVGQGLLLNATAGGTRAEKPNTPFNKKTYSVTNFLTDFSYENDIEESEKYILSTGVDNQWKVKNNLFTVSESSENVPATWREVSDINGNAMIGCFNYNGKTALYVVNYSMEEKNSTDEIKIELDANYDIQVIQNATTSTYNSQTIPLQMTPGEGVLIVID